MTLEQPEQPELDRYLDGLLDDEARRRFESRLASDASLRQQVEHTRSIESSIVRMFTPPHGQCIDDIVARVRHEQRMEYGDRIALSAADERAAGPKSGTAGFLGGWRHRLAIAAVLVLTVVSMWVLFQSILPTPSSNPYGPQAYRPIEEVWHDTLAAGFEPLWQCRTDRQFVTEMWRRLGAGAILESDLPTGVSMAGLSFANTISEGTMVMLGHYRDEPILLFVDRLANDTDVRLPDASSGLNTYRREVPPLVIYEVSQLDEPHLMMHVNPYEMPEEWIPGRNRPGTVSDASDESDG